MQRCYLLFSKFFNDSILTDQSTFEALSKKKKSGKVSVVIRKLDHKLSEQIVRSGACLCRLSKGCGKSGKSQERSLNSWSCGSQKF